jgi:hypothetical protein
MLDLPHKEEKPRMTQAIFMTERFIMAWVAHSSKVHPGF